MVWAGGAAGGSCCSVAGRYDTEDNIQLAGAQRFENPLDGEVVYPEPPTPSSSDPPMEPTMPTMPTFEANSEDEIEL